MSKMVMIDFAEMEKLYPQQVHLNISSPQVGRAYEWLRNNHGSNARYKTFFRSDAQWADAFDTSPDRHWVFFFKEVATAVEFKMRFV